MPNYTTEKSNTIAYHSSLHSPHTQPSWGRWWRQLCFVPYLQQKWLNTSAKQILTQAIQQAEQGHESEICLIIENHLPLATARYQDCYHRAIELFGLYGVWDTEDNTGILIYLNQCEHRLEIIADRGIHQAVDADIWQNLCQQTLEKIKQKQQVEGLHDLIIKLGDILRRYYEKHHSTNHIDRYGNELKDDLIFLK